MARALSIVFKKKQDVKGFGVCSTSIGSISLIPPAAVAGDCAVK